MDVQAEGRASAKSQRQEPGYYCLRAAKKPVRLSKQAGEPVEVTSEELVRSASQDENIGFHSGKWNVWKGFEQRFYIIGLGFEQDHLDCYVENTASMGTWRKTGRDGGLAQEVEVETANCPLYVFLK